MKLGNMPLASLSDVPFQEALTYACRDADATCRLKPRLWERIEAMGLEGVYRLELDTYHLIDRMMMVGIKPDLERFASFSERLQEDIDVLQGKLNKVTGIRGFNANSHDQVRELFFGTYGLPESKRTPGGEPSTNDIILEAMEKEFGVTYPAIPLTRDYRETYKLKNTFVDRIPDFVKRYPFDGRVHATFRTTRVVTGRLAASDPNLLALPEHGDLAYLFKYGWVAEEGHVLGAWDESQIELRVLADLSRDPVLLAAYRDGLDLHAALAVRIFGGKEADHKKGTGRLAAKAINFGIPMGMMAQGLCLQLRKNGLIDVDEDDAQRWLDETAALYKGVQRYKSERIAEARRHGYVRCLSGRVRYIGGIRSWDKAVKAEAERFAFSTPIQEGAQWIMKQAEAHLWKELRRLWKLGYWVEPLMQVHDAIKLEMEEGLELYMNKVMRRCMIEAVGHNLCVPLEVEGEFGKNLAPTKVEKDGKLVWSNPDGMRSFKEAA
jgi:DNA polymerase-1